MAGNLIDYIEWRGDIPFEQDGINVVDALIFSTLTYINYPDCDDKYRSFKAAYDGWLDVDDDDKYRGLPIMRGKTEELAGLMGDAERYKDVRITRYVEISDDTLEKQFSAMTFILPDSSLFIAFRGTDSTLVGWKEDFNMAIVDGTPSQLEATEYVENVAKEYPNVQLILGGHSKGGNLAVWAAVHMSEDVKSRIKIVFNFDAPGLSKVVSESDEYQSIKHKILTVVPHDSVVGMIMRNETPLVVKCEGDGLLQHNPFNWNVSRNDFVYVDERTIASRILEKGMQDIVEGMDRDEYSHWIDKIYSDLQTQKKKLDLLQETIKDNINNLRDKWND